MPDPDPYAELFKTLRFEDEGETWLLTGTCPQCTHEISKRIPKEVVLGLTFTRKRAATPVRTTTLMTCNCNRHPKADGTLTGCGFSAKVPLN
jgi:hypothetical protein